MLILHKFVDISLSTNCAPLVTDLLLYSYERNIIMSISSDTQLDFIDDFSMISCYPDDILNILFRRGLWVCVCVSFVSFGAVLLYA